MGKRARDGLPVSEDYWNMPPIPGSRRAHLQVDRAAHIKAITKTNPSSDSEEWKHLGFLKIHPGGPVKGQCYTVLYISIYIYI